MKSASKGLSCSDPYSELLSPAKGMDIVEAHTHSFAG